MVDTCGGMTNAGETFFFSIGTLGLKVKPACSRFPPDGLLIPMYLTRPHLFPLGYSRAPSFVQKHLQCALFITKQRPGCRFNGWLSGRSSSLMSKFIGLP